MINVCTRDLFTTAVRRDAYRGWGGGVGAPRNILPSSQSKFLYSKQFSTKILSNNTFSHATLGLPPPLGNPGSVTE